MNQVELIRTYIIDRQRRQLIALRQYISMVGENNDTLELIAGKQLDALTAKITDLILIELGHKIVPFKKDGRTQSSKAV